MQLEYGFTVPVPVSRAWDVLLDVERVVACVPGAALTSYDGESFTGTVRVKLGPVSLTYQGKGRFVTRDRDQGLVVAEASGRDSRGGGTAAATVTATLRPTDDGVSTVVSTVTDLAVTGRPAQFGRGMITEVGGRIVGQFAGCLAELLAEAPPAVPAGAAAEAPATEAPAAEAPATEALSTEAPPTGPLATETSALAASPSTLDATAPRAAVAGAPPVDLLRVGAGPVLRRLVPLVIAFLAGAAVAWALLTLL